MKLLTISIATVVAVLCVAGLIWWAEQSWVSDREKSDASAASSSSSISSSSADISSNDTQTTTSSSTSEAQSSSSASTANSSAQTSIESDANDPGNGVATDTASATRSTGQNGKVDAEILLSWWDADSTGISANGSVNNVVENGGTCTLTASKGSTVRSISKQSIANATTTACGEMTIPASQLGSGDWVIELKYSSNTASGSSDTQTVHIS